LKTGSKIVMGVVLAGAFAAAGSLRAQKAVAACGLLSQAQIKTVLEKPVVAGKSGDRDCTWADPQGGATRVYVSVKDPGIEYKSMRDSMQATGKLIPITGLVGDAFYVAGTGSAAALYALKGKHLLLITVDGVGFSKAQNEGAEKALAGLILPKL
jgi:hypothetical protein